METHMEGDFHGMSLVVAVSANGVIGRDGGMPWQLPSDLKFFKAYTMGKPIIMGRHTWESFPKRPLPGRRNIVITRNRDLAAEGAEIVGSLDEAIASARQDGYRGEICVIGGGQLYGEAIARADRLVVTHVLAEIGGDTTFPDIDPRTWYPASIQQATKSDRDSHETRLAIYERR
jgi:dihydrofolate reductase